MLFYVAHLPHILYSKKKKNLFGASSFINVFSEDSKERQHILPVQKWLKTQMFSFLSYTEERDSEYRYGDVLWHLLLFTLNKNPTRYFL